uniref:Uncharacterized protein n=1 Tax=Borely moumouvirus TaxID=2712067 RepID=A0A6G6AAF7_9VIRU
MKLDKYFNIEKMLYDLDGFSTPKMKYYVKNFDSICMENLDMNNREILCEKYYQFIKNLSSIEFNKIKKNYFISHIKNYKKILDKYHSTRFVIDFKNCISDEDEDYKIYDINNIKPPIIKKQLFYKSNISDIYLFYVNIYSEKQNSGIEFFGIIDDEKSKYIFCGIEIMDDMSCSQYYVCPFIITNEFYYFGLDHNFNLIGDKSFEFLDHKYLLSSLQNYYKQFHNDYFFDERIKKINDEDLFNKFLYDEYY